MPWIKLFALIWLVLLSSCGLVKSQNKIVSIDTNPREAKVIFDNKELGQTPLFQEIPKKKSGTYTFKYPDSKNKWQLSKTGAQSKKVCGHHGGGKALEIETISKGEDKTNLVSHLDPTSYFMSGKRYECVDVVRAKIPEMKNYREKKCSVYVVMPPMSGHAKFSMKLSKEWREAVFNKNKKDCDKVILPAVSQEFMMFLGINFLKAPRDLPDMRYKNVFKIGKKFKATHLVFLPFTSDGDKRTVTPKIYDIHKGKLDPDTPSKPFTVNIKQSGFTNFLLRTFRFLPNGVGGRMRLLNKLYAEGPGEDEFSKQYSNFDFGISLDNMQYPQREWMLGAQIAPALVWTKWGDKIEINTFGLTLDLKFFLHLPPGGVFVFRIGAGGAYMSVKADDYDYKISEWSYLADVGIEFYFFPLKRFYLNFGYKLYAWDPSKIQINDIQIKSESHFFIEIGYFFPELRMLVRKIL